MEKDSEYKVTFFGDGGVGLTCINFQLMKRIFLIEYDPTIEDTYLHELTVDGEVALLKILDTAGQEEFAEMRSSQVDCSDAFVVVYSIDNRKSFENLSKWFDWIERGKNMSPYPLCILVGNKCDLAERRQVSTAEGQDFARQKEIPFFETSAKTRENIEDLFFELVRLMRRARTEASGTQTHPNKPKCIVQ